MDSALLGEVEAQSASPAGKQVLCRKRSSVRRGLSDTAEQDAPSRIGRTMRHSPCVANMARSR